MSHDQAPQAPPAPQDPTAMEPTAMTVDELLNIFNYHHDDEHWETVNRVLPEILRAAALWYDYYDGIEVPALEIAALVVGRTYDEKGIVTWMRGLACRMQEVENLPPDIRSWFEQIYNSAPEPHSEEHAERPGP